MGLLNDAHKSKVLVLEVEEMAHIGKVLPCYRMWEDNLAEVAEGLTAPELGKCLKKQDGLGMFLVPYEAGKDAP